MATKKKTVKKSDVKKKVEPVVEPEVVKEEPLPKRLMQGEMDRLEINTLKGRLAEAKQDKLKEELKNMEMEIELKKAQLQLRETEALKLSLDIKKCLSVDREYKQLLIGKYNLRAKWGYDPVSGDIHEA